MLFGLFPALASIYVIVTIVYFLISVFSSLQQTPKEAAAEVPVESTAKRQMLSVQTETSFDADNDLKRSYQLNAAADELSPENRRYRAQSHEDQTVGTQIGGPANWGIFQRSAMSAQGSISGSADGYLPCVMSRSMELGHRRDRLDPLWSHDVDYLPSRINPHVGESSCLFAYPDFTDTSDSPEKILPDMGNGIYDQKLADVKRDTYSRHPSYRTAPYSYSGSVWKRQGTSTSEDEVDPNIPVRERPSYKEYLRQRNQRPREWKAPWRKDRRSKSTGRAAASRITPSTMDVKPVINGTGPLYDSDDSVILFGLRHEDNPLIYTNWKAAEQLRIEDQQKAVSSTYDPLLKKRIPSQTYYGYRSQGRPSKHGAHRSFNYPSVIPTPPVKETPVKNPLDPTDVNTPVSRANLTSSPALSILKEPFHNLLRESSEQLKQKESTAKHKVADPTWFHNVGNVMEDINGHRAHAADDETPVNKEARLPSQFPARQLNVSNNSAFRPLQPNGTHNGGLTDVHMIPVSQCDVLFSGEPDVRMKSPNSNQENRMNAGPKTGSYPVTSVSCSQVITNRPSCETALKSLYVIPSHATLQSPFTVRYHVAKNLRIPPENHTVDQDIIARPHPEGYDQLYPSTKRHRRSRRRRANLGLSDTNDIALSHEPYRRKTQHGPLMQDYHSLSISSPDSSTSPSFTAPCSSASASERPSVLNTMAGKPHSFSQPTVPSEDLISRPLVVTLADPRPIPLMAPATAMSPKSRFTDVDIHEAYDRPIPSKDIYFRAPRPFVSSSASQEDGAYSVQSPYTESNYEPLSTLITRITYPSDTMSASYNAYAPQYESDHIDILTPCPQSDKQGNNAAVASALPNTFAAPANRREKELRQIECEYDAVPKMSDLCDRRSETTRASAQLSEQSTVIPPVQKRSAGDRSAANAYNPVFSNFPSDARDSRNLGSAPDKGDFSDISPLRSTTEDDRADDSSVAASIRAELAAIKDSTPTHNALKMSDRDFQGASSSRQIESRTSSVSCDSFSYQSLAKYIPEPIKLKRQIGDRFGMYDRTASQGPSSDRKPIESSAQPEDSHRHSALPCDSSLPVRNEVLPMNSYLPVMNDAKWSEQCSVVGGRRMVTTQSETVFIESSMSSTIDANGKAVVTRTVDEGAFSSYGAAAKEDDRVTVIAISAGARRSWWSDRTHRIGSAEGSGSCSSNPQTASTSSDEIQQRRNSQKSGRADKRADENLGTNANSSVIQEERNVLNDNSLDQGISPSSSQEIFDDAVENRLNHTEFESEFSPTCDSNLERRDANILPEINKDVIMHHPSQQHQEDSRVIAESSQSEQHIGIELQAPSEFQSFRAPDSRFSRNVPAKAKFWERVLQEEKDKLRSPVPAKLSRPLYQPVSIAPMTHKASPAADNNTFTPESQLQELQHHAGPPSENATGKQLPKSDHSTDDESDDSYQQQSVIERLRMFENKASEVNASQNNGTITTHKEKKSATNSVHNEKHPDYDLLKQEIQDVGLPQRVTNLTSFAEISEQLPSDATNVAAGSLVSDGDFPSTARFQPTYLKESSRDPLDTAHSMTASYPPTSHHPVEKVPPVIHTAQHKIRLKQSTRSDMIQPRARFDISQGASTGSLDGVHHHAEQIHFPSANTSNDAVMERITSAESPSDGIIRKQQDYQAQIIFNEPADRYHPSRNLSEEQSESEITQARLPSLLDADGVEGRDEQESKLLKKIQKSGIQVMPFGFSLHGNQLHNSSAQGSLTTKKRIAQSDQWSINCPFTALEHHNNNIPSVASITFPSSLYEKVSCNISNTFQECALATKRLKVDTGPLPVDDASFEEITSPDNQTQRLVIRKPTKPPSRRSTASRNPIKVLHQREDVTTSFQDSTKD